MARPVQALRYPLAIDRSLGRVAREHDYDAYVKQLIQQVLLTSPGERINRPDFGAGARRLVFAPNGVGTASLAQTLIHQALTTWLGSLIRVEEVSTEAQAEKLLIKVVYTLVVRGERRYLNLEVAL
jgi:phage baseplate assembly protein W